MRGPARRVNDGAEGTTMQGGRSAVGGARIVLPGHADTVARVDVSEVPVRARVLRTIVLAAFWGTLTVAVFFITIFDPFMTSMPAFVGAASVYRSWRGRYALHAFQACCPRCAAELKVKPNAKVSAPHPLVCYACHHQPELVFA
jgi:hypothetical protein